MTNGLTRIPRWTRAILPAALILGIVLRLCLVALPPIVTPDSLARYETYARNLHAGHGFSSAVDPPYRPDAATQPGYPLLLAGIYGVAGEDRHIVVGVQLVLDLLIVLCVAQIARSSGLSPLAQATAIALALVCPVLPMVARAIWSECLATFVLWIVVLLAIRAARGSHLLTWALFGLGSSAALLVRPDLPPVVALLTVALAVHAWRRSRREALTGMGLALFGFALPLALWMMRNAHEFGAPQPLGTSVNQLVTPYQRWLGTWMDDRSDMPSYWWYLGDPGYATTFPANKVVDSAERARADALLGTGRIAVLAKENHTVWDELTAKARSERPLRTFVVVPFRRVAHLWMNVASYSRRRELRIVGTMLWGAFLFAALFGIYFAARRDSPLLWFLVAVIAGRSILPLVVGIACEPRYIAEAIPATFILFGFTLDGLLGSRLWTRASVTDTPG